MKLSEKFVLYEKDECGMSRINKNFALDSLKYGNCFVVHYARYVPDVSKQHIEVLFDNNNDALSFAHDLSNDNEVSIGFVGYQSKKEIPPDKRDMFYFGCWDLFKHRERINMEVEQ